MSGKSDGIWADLRKQRKIKYRDRDIMDYQHADFRGDSGVRFVCRLKGGAPVWSLGHLAGGLFLLETTQIQEIWRIYRCTL